MTHEIYIYGDIVPFKWLKDGSEFDRADLNSAIDSLDLQEGDELIYNIHTFGGCTTTAFAMYNKLKRVKNEKKITLTSRADGYCASSGVILLLAADKRIGSKYLKPFVHNAWTWAMGNKEDVRKVYEDLLKVDQAIAELYAEETTITVEEASALMDESRDLISEECLSYGFYTELENVKAVEVEETFNSILTRRQNQNKNMSNNKNKDAERKSILQRIENFLMGPQNKIVFTADNSELDFYELGEDDVPAVGDKAKFDGKAAGESNNGEYTMPSGEVYKFTGEELTEIVPKEEDATDDLAVENESLKKDIENLKTEIQNLKTEKDTVNKKLNDATEIINSFKNLAKDEDETEDEDGKRNPKAPKNEGEGSRISNAVKNLKKINTNGSN